MSFSGSGARGSAGRSTGVGRTREVVLVDAGEVLGGVEAVVLADVLAAVDALATMTCSAVVAAVGLADPHATRPSTPATNSAHVVRQLW
jgi:hypothetical protein